ncbi:phosphatase PAP2 family protein [Massilia sp. IC2-476]|uniref:phosphatase PAP2 family protein n=1 Tax=Massilia sp. IC2-476 TaxID=2887199 RepID=UPI001D117352|nr:phosphatase PAP2 family protein [Massilia sp. IC2-476]MCC2970505.1 phosphatase PAP2 family protein [Massilia sp. IC2-476]
MPVSATEAQDRLLGRTTAIRLGALLALAALLILALGAWTDADLWLADAQYDRVTAGFPWREAWLTATFSHRIAKTALSVCAGVIIALAIGDTIWPQRAFDRPLARLRLRVVAWSAVLVPLVVSLLKQSSNAHCPWDLARYGGAQPYVRLFEALPAGVLPGHCLPAGHASSALWLVSLVVFWLPGPARRAWRGLALCLAPGLALGWMQQMRGAHFLTHTLWSAWIACAIVLALVVMLSGDTGRRVPAGIRYRGR